MTYKSAVAGLPLGGGKGVIMLPDGPPQGRARTAALLDFADTVDALGAATSRPRTWGRRPAT